MKTENHNGQENRPTDPKGAGADEAVLGDSLQVSNAKLFIGDQEIGVCTTDLDIKYEFPEHEKIEIPRMEPITFEIELANQQEAMRFFKSFFKLPRKLKKKIYGTRRAKKKLYKLIKLGLPVTKKHFERAGYKVEITPANFA